MEQYQRELAQVSTILKMGDTALLTSHNIGRVRAAARRGRRPVILRLHDTYYVPATHLFPYTRPAPAIVPVQSSSHYSGVAVVCNPATSTHPHIVEVVCLLVAVVSN